VRVRVYARAPTRALRTVAHDRLRARAVGQPRHGDGVGRRAKREPELLRAAGQSSLGGFEKQAASRVVMIVDIADGEQRLRRHRRSERNSEEALHAGRT